MQSRGLRFGEFHIVIFPSTINLMIHIVIITLKKKVFSIYHLGILDKQVKLQI